MISLSKVCSAVCWLRRRRRRNMAEQISGAKIVGLLLTIFLIIFNLNNCAAKKSEETDLYDVDSKLPNIGSYSSLRLIRDKRQLTTDRKDHYQSVTQNAADSKQTLPPNNTISTERTTSDPSVVPFKSNEHLLGVNGTGQRKDSSDKFGIKPTVISTPIQTATTDDESKKGNPLPKKVLTVVAGGAQATLGAKSPDNPVEQWIDHIDVPENETINELMNQNLTVNRTTDHHNYYNSTIYIDKLETDKIWNLIKNTSHNAMLSKSHRRAMTIELTFDFPFYGSPVRNITVATGGFLYTGDYVHSWLAATQYIAPLMANFDTSLSNDSYVRLNDNGTAFTVIWENVSLQDKQDVGKFTFSTTLHKNGDIVFTYFRVPIFVNAIQDDKHPVKVGLSDAYIIDKVVYYARRKTIYEYHRVNFANSEITNSTVIYLKALPTCLDYSDCDSCIKHQTTFDCGWCTTLNRCSTGTDRKKQEWLQKGCDRFQINDASACPARGEMGNNANSNSNDPTRNSNAIANTNNDPKTDNDQQQHPGQSNATNSATITPVNIKPVSKEMKAPLDSKAEPKSMGMALGFLIPICVLASAMLWVLYAYRNPHTKSGQLLIQYRPSQWSWRRGEARYTAATIHM